MRTYLWKAVVAASALLVVCTTAVWASSHLTSIGLFALPSDTSLRIHRGLMLWEHTYALGATISREEFEAPPWPPERIVPRPEPLLGFAFSSGHVKGYCSTLAPESVPLATYWLLATPVWLLLLVVVGWPCCVFVWRREFFRSPRPLTPVPNPTG